MKLIINSNWHIKTSDPLNFVLYRVNTGKKTPIKMGYFGSIKACLVFIIKYESKLSNKSVILDMHKYIKELDRIKYELIEMVERVNEKIK